MTVGKAIAGWAAFVMTFAAAASGAGPAGADPRPDSPCPDVLVVAGSAVTCELGAANTHVFRIGLRSGAKQLLRIEQHDLEIAVTLHDAEQRITVDSPVEAAGSEFVLLETNENAVVEITVDAARHHGPAKSFSATLTDVAQSPASVRAARATMRATQESAVPENRRDVTLPAAFESAAALWLAADEPVFAAEAFLGGAELARGTAHGETAALLLDKALPLFAQHDASRLHAYTYVARGDLSVRSGDFDDARTAFRSAADILHAAGFADGAVNARQRLCLVDLETHRLTEAAACFAPLVAHWQARGETGREATARNNLGGVFYLRGDADRAREHFERALQLCREVGDVRQEVSTLSNLALAARAVGDLQEALRLYDRSLASARSIGDRHNEGRLLSNIGVAYYRAGELERALSIFEQALALRLDISDARGAAITLAHVGDVLADLDDLDGALDRHRQSMQIFVDLRLAGLQANAHVRMGRVHRLAGRLVAALDHYQQAEQLLASEPSPRRLANALQGQGDTLLAAGNVDAALKVLMRALALHEQTGDRIGALAARASLARVFAASGDADKADRYVHLALANVESLGALLTRPELRSAFHAAQRSAYELSVNLLLDRYQDDPSGDWHLQAFQVAQRSRTRGLLASLRESGVDLIGDVPPALQLRHTGLSRRLRGLATARDRALGQPVSAGLMQELDLRIEQALIALGAVEDDIRRASPKFASLSPDQSVDLRTIWQNLRDNQLLVQFMIGEDRSSRWVVSRDTLTVARLPAAQMLNEKILATYRNMRTVTAGRAAQDDLKDLSSALFSDMQIPTGDVSLVVVADGALNYLPFAALPDPWSGDDTTALLIDRVATSRVPSAALLSARHNPRERAQSPSIAIVTPRATGAPTLAGAANEADWLFDRFAPDRRRIFAGATATRKMLLDADLSAVDILHLAVHGTFDARFPALSALHLAGEDGAESGSSLRVADIYRLRLNAELVVLSACDTALGRQIAGEGLVGMTHGFWHAGARHVVASLWQVPDRATAVLMKNFYGMLLDDGLSPSQALRKAQLAVRATPGYRDPYYWAGFQAHGH